MQGAAAKAFNDIGLICRAGYDVSTLTPMVCRQIRRYLGAAAVAIFWMDANGMPVGFHHEDSPADARDLFANEFDRLFNGVNEINVSHLSSGRERQRIGVLLTPPESYYRSNTFNLLVRASGHHHALDMRVDVDAQTRIVVLAFREKGQPFTAHDAECLRRIEPALLSALRPSHQENWKTTGPGGHLIVDGDAMTIRFLDAAGDALLRECSLVGQQMRLSGPISTAPLFIEEMCRTAGSGVALRSLSIPSGRLTVSAERLRAPEGAPAPAFIVRIEKQVPMSLSALELVIDLKLSPTQKQLVISAARGIRRTVAADTLGLSNEALKKHLATIYSTLGVHGWDEIAPRVQAC